MSDCFDSAIIYCNLFLNLIFLIRFLILGLIFLAIGGLVLASEKGNL